MTIDNSSGNVGIALNDPDSKLEVSGRIHSVHDESGEANLWLERNTQTAGYGVYQQSAFGAEVNNYFQDPVGIGIVGFNTDNKLDVRGSVAIGAAYAGVYNAPSNSLIVENKLAWEPELLKVLNDVAPASFSFSSQYSISSRFEEPDKV